MQDPAIFSSPEYPKLARRQKYLESTIALFDLQQRLPTNLPKCANLLAALTNLAGTRRPRS